MYTKSKGGENMKKPTKLVKYIADNLLPSNAKITYFDSGIIYLEDGWGCEFVIKVVTTPNTIRAFLYHCDYTNDDEGYLEQHETYIKGMTFTITQIKEELSHV